VKSARRVSRYSLAKTSETLSKALVRARGYRLVSAGLSFVHSRGCAGTVNGRLSHFANGPNGGYAVLVMTYNFEYL
jgi:hypothetical protein